MSRRRSPSPSPKKGGNTNRTMNMNQSEEQLIGQRHFEASSADGKKLLPSNSHTPHDDTQTLAETKYSKFAGSSG